jgi:hypothetical protein
VRLALPSAPQENNRIITSSLQIVEELLFEIVLIWKNL